MLGAILTRVENTILADGVFYSSRLCGQGESLLTGAVHLLDILFRFTHKIPQKLSDSRNALCAQSYAPGRTYRKTPQLGSFSICAARENRTPVL